MFEAQSETQSVLAFGDREYRQVAWPKELSPGHWEWRCPGRDWMIVRNYQMRRTLDAGKDPRAK